jgi:hypothetical protein
VPRSTLVLLALLLAAAARLDAQSQAISASAHVATPVHTEATAPRISVDLREGRYAEVSAETPGGGGGAVIASVALSATGASVPTGASPVLVRDAGGGYRLVRNGAAGEEGAAAQRLVAGRQSASYQVDLRDAEAAAAGGVTLTYVVALNN